MAGYWILDIMYCFESDILFWFGLSVGFGWSGIGGGRASESNFYDRFKIQLFVKIVFGKILENMKILTGFKWNVIFILDRRSTLPKWKKW